MTGAEIPVATYVAAGTAVAGAAAEADAARRKRNQQRDILNQAFRKSSENADKANAAVMDAGADMDATKRLAEMQGEEAQTFGQTMRDLKASGAGGDIITAAGDAGNASADFTKAKADRALTEGNRMTAMAREMAKVRAPGQMQMNQGIRRADAQERAGSIWGSNRNMVDAYTHDAEGVQDPWYGTVGKLAKTAALAYLGA